MMEYFLDTCMTYLCLSVFFLGKSVAMVSGPCLWYNLGGYWSFSLDATRNTWTTTASDDRGYRQLDTEPETRQR